MKFTLLRARRTSFSATFCSAVGSGLSFLLLITPSSVAGITAPLVANPPGSA